jgi:hypothetical protein
MLILMIFIAFLLSGKISTNEINFLAAGYGWKSSHPVSILQHFIALSVDSVQKNDLPGLRGDMKSKKQFPDCNSGFNFHNTGISFLFLRQILAQGCVKAKFNLHAGQRKTL